MKKLRVLAVSAPQWSHKPSAVKVKSFSAKTPFSLQNAVRLAVSLAKNNDPVWKHSNWSNPQGEFSPDETVQLYEFFEEKVSEFERLLETLQPNILFLGAMSISFKGAVKLAEITKKALGKKCLVVLGGKHCNELLYNDFKSGFMVKPNNPLDLMKNGRIGCVNGLNIFDIVASGEGEELIVEIGRQVFLASEDGLNPTEMCKNLPSLLSARGKWVVGTVLNGKISYQHSKGIALDYSIIPTSPEVFTLNSRFSVFGYALTGHAYSDMGRGCRYNCFFCSERAGLNGRLRSVQQNYNPAHRLYDHLLAIHAQRPKNEKTIAAFVEDSIFLAGNTEYIDEFIALMRRQPLLGLEFGCQLTVNDVKSLSNIRLSALKEVGLSYIAIGMETVNENIAAKMSKHRKVQLWAIENSNAIRELSSHDINCGVYVLWGLGESQFERKSQLAQILEWRKYLRSQPIAVGLNWATHHPANLDLDDEDWEVQERNSFDYLQWSTPKNSKRLPFFVELFGEASEEYPTYRRNLPSVKELEELSALFAQIY